MCHVLVIEDEWMIAEYVADVVRDAGATSIATADTQRAAVEAARQCPPGIILSDVNLLEGTGPRAVQTIIAELGPVPVIFITATPQDCAPCEPPAVVLAKPVTVNGLTETFRRLAPLAC